MLDTPQATDNTQTKDIPQSFEGKKQSVAEKLQATIKKAAESEILQETVKVDALPTEEKPKVETKPEDDDFTSRMALLAKRERMILEQQNKIKEREAIILENEEARQKAKKDPRAALKMLGWEYDDLINAELNDFKPPEKKIEQELLETVTALKAEIESLKNKPKEELEAYKEEQFQNGVQAYKRGVDKFVQSNAEKYKYINKLNGIDTVVEVAKEIFKNEKYEPTFEEACDRVEAYIRAETKKQKELLLSLESEQPIDDNESTSSKSNSEQKIQLNSQAPRTLSSQTFNDSATSPQQRHMSFEERKQRAAKLVEKIRQSKA